MRPVNRPFYMERDVNPTSPTELAQGVEGAALMQNVRALARWQKLSGTPEERESFDYVQGVLDGMGWKTELILHDAYISLPIEGYVTLDGVRIDGITHSFSRPSPDGGVTGTLVYVGDGSEDAFAAVDVAGKIAVIEGIAKPHAAWRSSQAGAIGQIHLSPGRLMHEMCISPVWGSPSAETLGNLPSTVAVTLPKEEGAALRERLTGGEMLTATLHAKVDTGWRKTPILQADLPAPNAAPDAPFVLFSGHLDTWYYGVMDNGTADATILEVARLAQARQGEWQRSLRLCFWSGHSHGRYSSSAWYADNFWHELDKRCVAHVNVDSTGGKGADVLVNSGSNSELRVIATNAVKEEAGQDYLGKRLGRQGDESFWGVGIPAMFGSLSHHAPDPNETAHMHLGWWWHTPADTLDNIDEDNLVRDTRVFANVVWQLLATPLLPLDYGIHAADLSAELASLAEKVAPFDISALHDAAETLLGNFKAFHDTAANASGSRLDAMNAALLHVSRALVPMDSTRGDRFVHDPAMPQPGWPVLAPIRALATIQQGSDEWHFQATSARRSYNRMLHAMNDANDALKSQLAV